jgi:hypothetical protein
MPSNGFFKTDSEHNFYNRRTLHHLQGRALIMLKRTNQLRSHRYHELQMSCASVHLLPQNSNTPKDEICSIPIHNVITKGHGAIPSLDVFEFRGRGSTEVEVISNTCTYVLDPWA